MEAAARLLEIMRSLGEAMERGDDGDMDSPAWENDVRLLRLYSELKVLARHVSLEAREELERRTRTTDQGSLTGLPAT